MQFFRRTKSIVQSFIDNDCYTKSSTLTFYSIQSIVPVLAFALALGKFFGFEEYLEREIAHFFQGQQEVLSYVLRFAQSTLDQVKNSFIIGLGFLILIWTNVNLLGYIETSLNSIWKVKSDRTILEKFRDFIPILIFCPIIFGAASAATIFIRHSVEYLSEYYSIQSVGNYILLLFKFVPILLICLLFFIIYLLIPNTKMHILPRLFAALIAGSAFQLWQHLFIDFQAKIFNYSVVYGAFAIFPLFIIWLQFSWLIVLFGAEIAANLERQHTATVAKK